MKKTQSYLYLYIGVTNWMLFIFTCGVICLLILFTKWDEIAQLFSKEYSLPIYQYSKMISYGDNIVNQLSAERMYCWQSIVL